MMAERCAITITYSFVHVCIQYPPKCFGSLECLFYVFPSFSILFYFLTLQVSSIFVFSLFFFDKPFSGEQAEKLCLSIQIFLEDQTGIQTFIHSALKLLNDYPQLRIL